MLEGAETGGSQVHTGQLDYENGEPHAQRENLSQKILWLSRKSSSLETQVGSLETTEEATCALSLLPQQSQTQEGCLDAHRPESLVQISRQKPQERHWLNKVEGKSQLWKYIL